VTFLSLLKIFFSKNKKLLSPLLVLFETNLISSALISSFSANFLYFPVYPVYSKGHIDWKRRLLIVLTVCNLLRQEL